MIEAVSGCTKSQPAVPSSPNYKSIFEVNSLLYTDTELVESYPMALPFPPLPASLSKVKSFKQQQEWVSRRRSFTSVA